MLNNEMTVVIETGSSAITGAMGYKRSDGVVEVVACVSEPSKDFIRYGVVHNMDQTAQSLTNIINRLEGEVPGLTIDKVYVGLGGYTFHSVHNQVKRGFDEETRITTEMTESMIDDNLEGTNMDKVVIEVVPQEYEVDGLVTNQPVGCNCRHIVGEYLNLESRLSTMENLKSAFDAARVPIVDSLVSPLLLANAALTPTERSLGCTLVDMGAGTTTVSIYKGDRLRFLSVIPLGDHLVTMDLVSLGIGVEEAERIKRTIGLTPVTDEMAKYVTESGNEIPMKNISFAIRARVQEILANVVNQVKVAGFDDGQLNAGFIFTGGALEIPGIVAYMNTMNSLNKLRVATLQEGVVVWTAPETPIASKQLLLTALIAAGEENCVTIDRPEPKPVKEIDYSRNDLTTGSLFTDDGEDAQAERDRLEAERREAEAKEAAAKASAAKEANENAGEEQKHKRMGFFTRLQQKLMKALDEPENDGTN